MNARRQNLLTILERMPSEAFMYLVQAIATGVWPDETGGFEHEHSQPSIAAAKEAAQELIEHGEDV
jgi:hypothetical protein